MKTYLMPILTMLLTCTTLSAQNVLPKVYDESIDPLQQIESAVSQAAPSHKYTICQVGGNWCVWCLRFADFIIHDDEIKQIVNDNFVYIHVNYHPKKSNPELMKRLGNPGRFGYPVFVILDERGKVLHIQNSAYLELDKSYDRKKVVDFFRAWTPTAVNTIK